MQVNKILAGIAVPDFDRGREWYATLFGRPADADPMPGLTEWHAPDGVVQLVDDAERAGGSLVTVWVTDARAALAELAARGGPATEPDETTSDKVVFATLNDPDNNAITIVEVKPGTEV